MRISEAGNLTNWMMAGTGQRTPQVGDGCTILMYKDRHAATIIDINKTGKTIKVQIDKATRIDSNGMSESQTYEYTPNPTAPSQIFRRTKDNRWKELKGSSYLLIGKRDEFYDFTF